MHPNGQLPAYEWAFDDVNPPVHAWAALRVYKIEAKRNGGAGDCAFLERVFQKLLLNFTWWVNRKDLAGRNIFQGGFLGLDNIGVFDRSAALPTGGYLAQTDGTTWMGVYCAQHARDRDRAGARSTTPTRTSPSSSSSTSCYIADAMNADRRRRPGLWDEGDGFYYDQLFLPDGERIPLKVRSVGRASCRSSRSRRSSAGMLEQLAALPAAHRVVPARTARSWPRTSPASRSAGMRERRLLAIVNPERLRRILRRVLDESEFLSPHGIRSLSRFHRDHPYVLQGRRGGVPRRLRAGRVDQRPLRRQLELARPGLVPAQLPADRGAAEVPLLPGRRVHGRVPDGLGHDADALGVLARALAPAGRRSSAATTDGKRPFNGDDALFQTRPALARPDPLPRVLPRRHRRGARRQPPDRLDGARRQADPAARRLLRPGPRPKVAADFEVTARG